MALAAVIVGHSGDQQLVLAIEGGLWGHQHWGVGVGVGGDTHAW